MDLVQYIRWILIKLDIYISALRGPGEMVQIDYYSILEYLLNDVIGYQSRFG